MTRLDACALAFVLVSAPAVAADYFVSPTGADTNGGLSPADAFRTVQKGTDTAGPGCHCTLQMTVATPLPGAVDAVPGNDSTGIAVDVIAP